jgi:hypothetical protein
VTDARPVIADLRALANSVRPVGTDLREVLESFRDTGGIERLMDYIFYQVAAVNGFDSVGHYLRAGLMVNQCATYAVEPVAGCSANFPPPASSSGVNATASAVDAVGEDPVLRRTAIALARALGQFKREGEDSGKAAKPEKKARAKSRRAPPTAPAATATPNVAGVAPTPSPDATAAPQGAPAAVAPAPAAEAPAPTATAAPSAGPSDALLDYLFGQDGGG